MNAPSTPTDWLELGYEPIPLHPNKKQPLRGGWPDKPAAQQWANAPTGANLGLRCGGGLAVLDADDKNQAGTSQAVAAYMSGLGLLPGDYPEVQTPSNGRHFYISLTGPLPEGHVLTFGGSLKGELRHGRRAYVAAPPSLVDGRPYVNLAGDFRQLPRVSYADLWPILKIGELQNAPLQHDVRCPCYFVDDADEKECDCAVYEILCEQESLEADGFLPNPSAKVPRGTRLLLKGQGGEKYASRSEHEQAIMQGLANVCMPFEKTLGLYLNYPAGGKFSELQAANPQTALAWLRNSYYKAIKQALKPSQGRQEAMRAIAWAGATPWHGNTGPSDRATFLAHCSIAYDAGSTEYAGSIRRLVEISGLVKATVQAANARLLKAGLLAPVNQAIGRNATVYRLTPVTLASGWGQVGLPTDREVKDARTDTFRRAALGQSAGQVYSTLEAKGPQTKSQLAASTGRDVRTIARALKRMADLTDQVAGEALPMVEQDGKSWHALPVDFQGVPGIGHCGTRRERPEKACAGKRTAQPTPKPKEAAGGK